MLEVARRKGATESDEMVGLGLDQGFLKESDLICRIVSWFLKKITSPAVTDAAI